jgi:hypothetical protein
VWSFSFVGPFLACHLSVLQAAGVDINELNANGETPLGFTAPDCWGRRKYWKVMVASSLRNYRTIAFDPIIG